MEKYSWKSAGFGPRYQVEITETELSIDQNGKVVSIPINQIERIYLQKYSNPPVAHFLRVELVDRAGMSAAFHDSGYGAPDTDALTCQNAASALFRRLAKNLADVHFYEGSRPDKPFRFILAGAYLLAFATVVWGFVRFGLGRPEQAQGLFIGMSIFFGVGTVWASLRTKKLPEVSASHILDKLK